MSCIEYKDYTEQYRLLEKLGSGNCATVMRVEDRRTKKAYALKYAKFDSPAKLAVAFQEIEVVRAVDHDTAIKVTFVLFRSIITSLKIPTSLCEKSSSALSWSLPIVVLNKKFS